MNCYKQLAVLSLMLASSAVLAQKSLVTVEVHGDSERSMVIACDSPSKPSLKDVERVLQITDSSQTLGLRKELMGAAAEGCKAGEPRILVKRSGRSLTWEAMR